jgi:hypothetical protein
MAFDVVIWVSKSGEIVLEQQNGDQVTLNFRAWSVTEKDPEKVKVRKRDGKIIDDGYRVTGDFDRVTIYRRNSGKKSGGGK